jgi:glycosyltransferase involved in cell wall biosynthesis
LNLSKGLNELGVKVLVASSGGNALERISVPHQFIPLKTKSEISPKVYLSFRKLRRILIQEEVNIIHANTRITRVLANLLMRDKKIPFLSTAHGYYRPKLKNRILPCWGRKVIAISNFVKKHLLLDFKLPEDKVEVIYNGIDLDYFRKDLDTSAIKTKFGIGDELIISCISRLSDVKDLVSLIYAFRDLLEEHKNIKLLIGGEGKQLPQLERLILELSLKDKVKLLGLIQDVRELLKVTDIFVLPSKIEGLGIAIIEALACGKAVIATNSGGIPEVIKDGYNGLLVKPSDPLELKEAMSTLIREVELREELCKNALASVEKFNYKEMAVRTLKVYEDVLRKWGS